MKPKKSLGQNFLTSVPAREAMVTAGNIKPNDTILEIGPGRGFLTEPLLLTGAHVIALEKDRELIEPLKEKFKDRKNLEIIEGDVLTYEPPYEPYKLIANIPYYITGAILQRFLSHTRKPSRMVVLVQREVADRIVASDKKESILSLSVKVYGTPKIIKRVDKGSFFPKPKVDSAVLLIENISSSHFKSEDQELYFFILIKAGFLHKRKLLLSNIREVFPHLDIAKIFQACSIDPKARAEDVTLSTWILLSQAIVMLV